jgi:hypothetical protein
MIGELSNTVELQLLLLWHTLRNQKKIIHKMTMGKFFSKRTIHVCCRREMVEESSAASMERDVAKLCNIMQRYAAECQHRRSRGIAAHLHQLA